jgi:hypothetical protein
VGSIFDVPEAWRIRDLLESSDSHERILIDFRRTQEFHDFALAALVSALSKIWHPPVAAVGLGAHQVSILRYLGCDPQTLEPTMQAEAAMGA